MLLSAEVPVAKLAFLDFVSTKDSIYLKIYFRCHQSRVLSEAHSAAGGDVEAIIGTLFLCRCGPVKVALAPVPCCGPVEVPL